MRVIRDTAAMQALAIERRSKGVNTALVPTMGALHEGHLSLIRLAHEHGDEVDVTIFVNPTQFGPGEDLSRYPRTLERDLELCRKEGVATVFCPNDGEVYAADHSTQISETSLSSGLCGAYRPGHFDGVVTVVAKLFNIMLPTAAVFGRKDFQQARAIQRMVRDLNFPVRIVLAPIVREPDGLAMSSRNRYLSEAEREQALSISRALKAAETEVAGGSENAEVLQRAAEAAITAAGLEVQYVACVDADTLEPVARVGRQVVLAVAALVGNTRLIDNVVLQPSAS
ncbi:MAG: pantoate--beta-alanine ligase [Kiritimatiellae bacterium]|nr:pantoate--beta-alanine ligase [Kiritimatiellia bacterium]